MINHEMFKMLTSFQLYSSKVSLVVDGDYDSEGDHDSEGNHDSDHGNCSKENITEPPLHRDSPYSSWETSSTEKVKYILTNRGIALFDSSPFERF